MKGKQMTVRSTGAPSGSKQKWQDLDWTAIEAEVRRLQMRIAKATREGRYGKVRSLQWLLTHSYYAKLLAVKRVSSNKGSKTPGVDGEIWSSGKRRLKGAIELRRRGYKAQPLRRIYIPKKTGKLRPLGIPTIRDRAMQALYLLALEPVVESVSDPNSYGFRPKRSTQDAIQQCFIVFSRRNSATWTLEADIKSCFDQISHQWLLDNVVVDRLILEAWLKSGYLEKQAFFSTEEGTPQGGIISPTLANIALNGLELAIKDATKCGEKVNTIRYADDFVVSGVSREVLERLKPVIESFLSKRGLTLSQEKTKITSIYDGFDFLGFNVRKYGNKLLIKPSKANVKKIRATVRELARKGVALPTISLIRQLNPKLLGWANYYRHVVSSRAFARVDAEVFQAIWRWSRKRHPNKSCKWVRQRYFRQRGGRNWIFHAKARDASGATKLVDLLVVNSIAIKRYVKIRANATPYDPEFKEYFEQRSKRKKSGSSGYWEHHIATHHF